MSFARGRASCSAVAMLGIAWFAGVAGCGQAELERARQAEAAAVVEAQRAKALAQEAQQTAEQAREVAVQQARHAQQSAQEAQGRAEQSRANAGQAGDAIAAVP